MITRHFSAIALLSIAAVTAILLVSNTLESPRVVDSVSNRDGDKDLGYYLNIPITPDQRQKGVAEAKRAVALATERKDDAALEAYRSAMSFLPNLGDWLAVFSAGVSATAADTAEVTTLLADLDSVMMRDWAWRTRLRGYRNAHDRAGAIKLAEAAAAASGSVRRRSEASHAVAEIKLELGDTASARKAFARSIDVAPFSDIALDAAKKLNQLGRVTPSDQLRIGRTFIRFGNHEQGIKALRAYLASASANPDTSARVRLELGRTYFNTRKYKEADRVLVDLAAKAGPSVAAEALFLAGRAQLRENRERQSKQTFLRVAQRFPKHDAAARALFLLADLEHDEKQMATATRYYRQAISARPGSESGGLSYMRLATTALANGKPAEAARILEQYRTAYPRGARNQQANYWAGRAYGEMGDQATAAARWNQARSLDPYTSYGVRAATRLDREVLAGVSPDPVTPAATTNKVNAALLRLDMLDEIGWTDAAAFELQRIRRFFASDTVALFALAEGLNQRNRVTSGITLGRELDQAQPKSLRLLKILYPLPYQELIVPAAKQYGIDPYLMAALIRQESAFNPRATSSAGAMGLMQVMPATGRQVAGTVGIQRFDSSMLHQPEINVRIGARYLADVIASWKGRVDYVLAEYNAGPTRMARWKQYPEAHDSELFMERIPFEETRDYVRVVQLNARIYEALYGSDKRGAADKN